MRLDSIQPSQLYISSAKLHVLLKRLRQSGPVQIQPISIRKLGDQIVLVDGHTRALAAFLLNITEIPVYWEDEELNWDEYETCVSWCKEEGIHAISDLENRVVCPREYQALWLDRCKRMQQQLGARKKAIQEPETEHQKKQNISGI